MNHTNHFMNRNLVYKDHKGHLTNEMLNDAYGEYCMSFKTLSEAGEYAKKHNKSYINKLIAYVWEDVEIVNDEAGKPKSTKIKSGAKPYTKGWLVS